MRVSSYSSWRLQLHFTHFYTFSTVSTVCVTGAGAGVDTAWEQKKLEARKMLENARRIPSVQCTLCWAERWERLLSHWSTNLYYSSKTILNIRNNLTQGFDEGFLISIAPFAMAFSNAFSTSFVEKAISKQFFVPLSGSIPVFDFNISLFANAKVVSPLSISAYVFEFVKTNFIFKSKLLGKLVALTTSST